ncbi:MAG: hypothetical protein AB1416_10040, partial [Actinomycetota bacterium]
SPAGVATTDGDAFPYTLRCRSCGEDGIRDPMTHVCSTASAGLLRIVLGSAMATVITIVAVVWAVW